MALTITFNDSESQAIEALIPLLKGETGQGVNDPKEVLLIALAILIKARGCEIRTIGHRGEWTGQFNVWRSRDV